MALSKIIPESLTDNARGMGGKFLHKITISNDATVGFYWWKKGSDFVKYAMQMIDKDIRTNNEFYVCPVYNEAIADGKKILPYHVKEMWGLGTPEELDKYLNK